MTIMIDLYDYLRNQSSLTSLIGDRIFPLEAPQGTTKPYVVYRLDSDENAREIGGPSIVSQTAWQIDCYGATLASVDAVNQVLTGTVAAPGLLDGFRGQWGNTDVRSVAVVNILQNLIQPTDGSDIGVYVVTLLVEIWATR